MLDTLLSGHDNEIEEGSLLILLHLMLSFLDKAAHGLANLTPGSGVQSFQRLFYPLSLLFALGDVSLTPSFNCDSKVFRRARFIHWRACRSGAVGIAEVVNEHLP